MECWPFFRAVQKTVLKLSEFEGHEGHWSSLTPSDKWIGNKLPNSRNGPLILIKADLKKAIRATWECQQPSGCVQRFPSLYTQTHFYTDITTSWMPGYLPQSSGSLGDLSLLSFFIRGWCYLLTSTNRHPPSSHNSLPCPISWAWLKTKRQAFGTEWPGQWDLMEKSGVGGIMARARQKSRTMATACAGKGQACRDYNANLVSFLYIL